MSKILILKNIMLIVFLSLLSNFNVFAVLPSTDFQLKKNGSYIESGVDSSNKLADTVNYVVGTSYPVPTISTFSFSGLAELKLSPVTMPTPCSTATKGYLIYYNNRYQECNGTSWRRWKMGTQAPVVCQTPNANQMMNPAGCELAPVCNDLPCPDATHVKNPNNCACGAPVDLNVDVFWQLSGGGPYNTSFEYAIRWMNYDNSMFAGATLKVFFKTSLGETFTINVRPWLGVWFYIKIPAGTIPALESRVIVECRVRAENGGVRVSPEKVITTNWTFQSY